MKSSELREKFLNYFEAKAHLRLNSSSLVPSNDPTLFFTNAGMVQFKEYFLGEAKPPKSRMATSQKCMRVSGKHNDLENVGHTPRHHTFFEMLGNFSFGDYFKEDAIAFAWEFLTKELGLDPKRMFITVFREDDEAEQLWKKHVPAEHIFRLDEADNFWSMGETGPCGPCSEIMWDFESGPVQKTDFETDRFMEIWNLVFMQFDQQADGKKVPLQAPSIDTGMGLERLAAVVQGKRSNWETDLFIPIIRRIEEITGHKESESEKTQVALRVIADHIRTSAFLIADGVTPSNEGRGYVLRRIMRRAIRYGKFLGQNKPFFTQVFPTVLAEMGEAFPELKQNEAFILKVIANEEERFFETLERGLDLLEKHFTTLTKGEVLSGEIVFKLYDTFGFPKDLTEIIARENGFSLDDDGFEKCMQQQRERARASWKGSGEEKIAQVWQELTRKGVSSEFVGYEKDILSSKVSAIVLNGASVDEVELGDKFQFVAVQTPFYGESGGQVGDVGVAKNSEVEIEIVDTTKPISGLYVHHATIKKGVLKVGDKIDLSIDSKRRNEIRCNHTATHLLHKALRKTLGEHVKQAGSLVDESRLRFDFSHFQAVSKEEIAKIETMANNAIKDSIQVDTHELSYDEAIERGALAFFGDTYGTEVRMVAVGDFSIELCGGTHVKNTSDIKQVKITSEASVAAGVRRIEAVTADRVETYLLAQAEKSLAKQQLAEQKEQRKQATKERLKLAQNTVNLDDAREVGGVQLLIKRIDGLAPKELRELATGSFSNIKNTVIFLASETEGKVALVAKVSSDLTDKIKAGDIIRETSAIVDGKGGGKAELAQGGGSAPDKLNEALQKVEELIK